jgi:hypothetical protein
VAAIKQSEKRLRPAEIGAGVIGLGLMGHSIVACLLSAGHEVIAVTRDVPRHRATRARVLQLLHQMKREGLLKRKPEILVNRLSLSNDCGDLAGCDIVIESITEDIETKGLSRTGFPTPCSAKRATLWIPGSPLLKTWTAPCAMTWAGG